MKTFFRKCEPPRSRRRRPFLLPAALCAVLALAAPAGSAFSGDMGVAPPRLPARDGADGQRTVGPGAEAPGFSLKDIAGDGFDFEAEKARSPFVLVFFSMFCEPCRRELAIVQKIFERHRDAGWGVAAVSLDGEPLSSGLAGFVRQEGYGFRVLVDRLDGRDMFRTAVLYGVTGMPETFVIEKGGRVVFARKGLVMEEEIEKFMRPAGKP
jgi:peroxiredoxin